MKLKALATATAIAVVAGAAIATAQQGPNPNPAATPNTVDGHISAGKAAAGTMWTGTFARLCIPPPGAVFAPPPSATPPAGAQGTPPAPPARETWYAEPAKVGDNFYWLGDQSHHSWALVGNQGIILIEANFEYMVKDEVAGGLAKMGLDMSKVKYALMSHAHGDHDGGAAFLQDSIAGMKLLYGKEDWDAVDASTNRPGGKPKHDMIATDGLKLSVGDASLQVVTMPGHTPGTISYLFEFKDNGKPIKVAYIGGTAIPFNQTDAWYDGYIASNRKFAKAAADYGATAIMSNHTEFDNGWYRAATAANRKSKDIKNPFDTGASSVAAYMKTVEECATASKMRAAAARAKM